MRLAVVTLVAGAALAVPAAPSRAAECSGVPVVVDFASLGGGSRTGCAPGDPSSGITALRSAGFEPTRAAQQPGYFVCRIDGKPASDPCQRTSPADAYWSYWHARAGGSWTYSGVGPADHDPEPGTVEGWAFGAGKPPSTAPPPRAAASPSAQPSPQPSRLPSPQPSPQAPQQPAPPPASAASSEGLRTPSRPAAVASSDGTGTPSPRPASVAGSAGPRATSSPVASSEGSSSTPADPPDTGLPFAAGLVVLALLAAAGARLAWLRRDRG